MSATAETATALASFDVSHHLCGLCGCGVTKHTPTHCSICGEDKPHEFVRADVLTCTLLASVLESLDRTNRLLFINKQLLEKLVPDPKGARIVLPH